MIVVRMGRVYRSGRTGVVGTRNSCSEPTRGVVAAVGSSLWMAQATWSGFSARTESTRARTRRRWSGVRLSRRTMRGGPHRRRAPSRPQALRSAVVGTEEPASSRGGFESRVIRPNLPVRSASPARLSGTHNRSVPSTDRTVLTTDLIRSVTQRYTHRDAASSTSTPGRPNQRQRAGDRVRVRSDAGSSVAPGSRSGHPRSSRSSAP